jgi:hypothetical protein
MRMLAVLVAMAALSPTAFAQTPQCKSLSDPGARLACYDKAAQAPATSSAATKPALRASPASNVDAVEYVDSISEEDVLMNAKLKNICRGC